MPCYEYRGKKYRALDLIKEIKSDEQAFIKSNNLQTGKWRYEVPDGKLKDNWQNFDVKSTLADVWDDPELYKAYPQLKDVVVAINKSLGNGAAFVTKSDGQKVIEFGHIWKHTESAMAHEIQHAIQEIEGFARGGNTETHVPLVGENKAKIIKADSIWRGLGKSERSRIKGLFESNNISRIPQWNFVSITETEKIDDAIEQLEILNKEYPNQDIVDALNVLADLQDLTVGDAKYERYRRLAGEVESRNVQTRMNYTPEQRRESLLEETEDVSRKDQIFIYDGLGASLENSVNLQDNITEYENNLYEAGQQYLPTKRNRPGTGSEIQEDYKGLENWTEEQFPKYASKIRSALNRHFNNNEYLSAEEVDDIAFGISELRKTGTQYLTQRDINAAKALLERRGYYQMADNKSLTDSLKDHYYDLVKGKIRYNPIVEESIAEYNTEEPSILRMVATPKKGLGEAIEQANIKYRQSKERKETFKEVVYQIRQNLQDNALPIRKFVENVKELGGTVKERMNVYNAYFRAFGRAEELHRQFTEQKWTPVVKAVAALQKSGVDGEYIVPYLIAKHGPERNLYMREQALQEWIQIEEQKKGAKPSDIEIEEKRAELSVKDYSGISGFDPEWKDNYDTMEEMAETITKDFESIADPQLVKDLHDALAVANKEVLDQWLAGRQITQKEYDDYKKRFKYFIPLRGWEDDAAKRFRYNKSSGFGRSLKHAQGRTSFAENPLANMQSVAFKAIGERVDNEVKESLLSLIVNNYETKFKSLYKIHKAYYRRGIDENGEVIYDVTKIKPTKEQLDSGEYTYEFHPQYMRLRTPANAMEHEVLVRKQGGDILIVFENNPEVAQAINHQNTMFKFHGEMVDAKSLNIVTKVFTWATNWIKAINTSYNPVFPLTNFARDVQEATAHIAISMGLDIGKDIPKLVPRAMKTAARRIYGKSTGTADDNLLQRFYDLGAATGWTHGKSIEELQKELDNELKDLLRKGTIKGATKQAWNGLLNGIQSWNQIFEDTTRFAVFMAVREAEIKKGESVQDAELAAATAAKEASLNFNRKGRITKFLDAIWAFFNPAVQGMQKNFALAIRHKKRFWGAAGSMMVFGFIEAMLNDMGDGDDDKYYDINEWSRRNYIVIRTGEKFVRIPLPQFWRGFHSLGVIVYDAITGRTKPAKGIFDVTTNFIGGLSPIDIPGLFPNGEFNISPLAPSAVKPFIDLAYNKNYFQDQIYKEPYTKGVEKFKASSVMYDKNVNPIIKGATEFLAKNVGGRYGESKSSMRLSWMGDFSPLDWNPSKIEYLIQQYTGGIGRIANDITKVAMAATMDEEDVKLNNIPFANSFVRTIPEGKWNVVNQYREYNNDNQEFSDELKEAKRLKDLNKLLELTADEKNKQIYGILNSTNKAMDKIIDAYGYEDEKWSDERIKMMNNAIAKIDSIEQEYKNRKQ